MTRYETIRQLETIIGKLSKLNYAIIGNQLQEAIRETAHVRDRVRAHELDIRKINKSAR